MPFKGREGKGREGKGREGKAFRRPPWPLLMVMATIATPKFKQLIGSCRHSAISPVFRPPGISDLLEGHLPALLHGFPEHVRVLGHSTLGCDEELVPR